MIRESKSFLIEQAPEWKIPEGLRWSFLLHNNYHPHCSNINLLWFHNGSEFPRVVTKLYRQPDILKREFENLTKVHSVAPTWVPKPLHFGPLAGFWALWMEGVPGVRLTVDGHSAAMLRSVTEMVVSIHGTMLRTEREPDPERHRRVVLQPLQTVAGFGDSAAVRAGCEKMSAAVSEEWINSLPVIPQHGDLFLSNVVSHRGQYHVVDWESFGTIDLPFHDLVTLLFSLLRTGGEAPEDWDPSLAQKVPAMIEYYAATLGLPAAIVPRLFPLILANWFHLQWSDGRSEFTKLMYRTIQHYFERTEVWERIFCQS